MKVKVISLQYIFKVLYVLCFTRPRYQVSVYRTIGPLVVLEALSREFHTGCPWELLYADDLMISAESMEELLVKLKTWKTEMGKKGLRVYMGKTKIMVSGMDLDLLKKSGASFINKDPRTNLKSVLGPFLGRA